jgi:hypothetical protein
MSIPVAPPTPTPTPTPTVELPAYGSIKTWGDFMRNAIGRDQTVVLAALHKHGVADLAALQNQTPSIPAIALELGMTGEV